MVINMSLSHNYKIKRAVFIVNYEVRSQKADIGIRPPAHRGGAYAPAGRRNGEVGRKKSEFGVRNVEFGKTSINSIHFTFYPLPYALRPMP
jgi:hypothetical protein